MIFFSAGINIYDLTILLVNKKTGKPVFPGPSQIEFINRKNLREMSAFHINILIKNIDDRRNGNIVFSAIEEKV